MGNNGVIVTLHGSTQFIEGADTLHCASESLELHQGDELVAVFAYSAWISAIKVHDFPSSMKMDSETKMWRVRVKEENNGIPEPEPQPER